MQDHSGNRQESHLPYEDQQPPEIKRGIVVLGPCEPKQSAALLMPHAHHQDSTEALAYLHPLLDEPLQTIFNIWNTPTTYRLTYTDTTKRRRQWLKTKRGRVKDETS